MEKGHVEESFEFNVEKAPQSSNHGGRNFSAINGRERKMAISSNFEKKTFRFLSVNEVKVYFVEGVYSKKLMLIYKSEQGSIFHKQLTLNCVNTSPDGEIVYYAFSYGKDQNRNANTSNESWLMIFTDFKETRAFRAKVTHTYFWEENQVSEMVFYGHYQKGQSY